MKAVTFAVTGRVQGVGYRWAAQEEARRLGLGGWIENAPGGVVSGYVQGPAAAVDEFAKWLKKGPKTATVKKVTTEPADVAGYRLFVIR
ncbi:MAG: acylphosphatase [Spirochaetales bacterium]